MTIRKGFFEGMPDGMQIRFVAWLVYFAVCGFVFFQYPILGGALFLLPIFWFVAKNWVLTYVGGRTDLERSDTVIGYTLDYLFFDAPLPVRIVSAVTAIALVVFSLGWVSTENLRFEAAKPTLTERVSTATGNAVDATKEKTGGWIDGVKGWFKGDNDQP